MELTKCADWFRANKLTLNTKQTRLIMFKCNKRIQKIQQRDAGNYIYALLKSPYLTHNKTHEAAPPPNTPLKLKCS